jgi:cytochrome c biogenesis protein CcmG, thiol:disulfide interchange protein DsbE
VTEVRRKIVAGILLAMAACAVAASIWIWSKRDARQAQVELDLPLLRQPERNFSAKSMLGTTWMLNLWASWCAPCLAEHPLLSEFARTSHVPIVGVNYMDRREAGIAWLQQHGDPYRTALFDSEGKIGAQLAVRGVPGTYVLDKRGAIRYRHIGPVTPEIMSQKILPLLRELEND